MLYLSFCGLSSDHSPCGWCFKCLSVCIRFFIAETDQFCSRLATGRHFLVRLACRCQARPGRSARPTGWRANTGRANNKQNGASQERRSTPRPSIFLHSSAQKQTLSVVNSERRFRLTKPALSLATSRRKRRRRHRGGRRQVWRVKYLPNPPCTWPPAATRGVRFCHVSQMRAN